MLQYTLKRSKRKTLAAHVLLDGTVEVRAPLKLDRVAIDKFVAQKEPLLMRYVKEQLLKQAEKDKFSVEIGSYILYLGKPFKVMRADMARIDIMTFFVAGGDIKSQVIKLYISEANRIIPTRLKYWSEIMGVLPTNVKINCARTRWGSCSAKGAVNFSWFLIMADMDAIDYVIIHELAHLIHMNHSKAFWAEVAKYDAKYPEHRKSLGELSKRLQTENW